jgi:hypothetical protein
VPDRCRAPIGFSHPSPFLSCPRELSRDAFVSHFQPVFQVHCLRFWRQRSKEPPETLPTCLHEWIKTANGRMDLDIAAFRLVVWPTIEEVHRTGKGARPTPDALAAALYDGLSAAGVEVTLGPMLTGHGA